MGNLAKFKLTNKSTGLSKKTGKPWYRLTLSSERIDGTRRMSDFWVTAEVYHKAMVIQYDAEVYVAVNLDQDLHFNICDVKPVNAAV